jgi:hypothetical protein
MRDEDVPLLPSQLSARLYSVREFDIGKYGMRILRHDVWKVPASP